MVEIQATGGSKKKGKDRSKPREKGKGKGKDMRDKRRGLGDKSEKRSMTSAMATMNSRARGSRKNRLAAASAPCPMQKSR